MSVGDIPMSLSGYSSGVNVGTAGRAGLSVKERSGFDTFFWDR